MEFMKLGTKPDFFLEEAARSVLSDVLTDLFIHVNNTKYLLHKFPLLLKCGIIQRLCSDSDHENGQPIPIAVHDIPGGEEAFELCVKFCYGITINLSAYNFVVAISAAKFLRMTESVAKRNFISKLELFFDSCILQGWKDSILTLQSMWRQTGWADDHRIVQTCMDSVIEKDSHPSITGQLVLHLHEARRTGEQSTRPRNTPVYFHLKLDSASFHLKNICSNKTCTVSTP